jgi:Ala-tRNA(Pro) deacylase
MAAGEREVLDILARLGIEARTHRHAAVFTVADNKALRGAIAGCHVKNLFLKDKKGQLWLVVTEEDRAVDLKRLRAGLGAAPLSFARPELVRDVLGVEPGSVTPLAVVNDPDGRVRVVLDRALMAAPMVNVHPLTNTATTSLVPADLLRFLEACGHPPRLVDLDEASSNLAGQE